MGLKICIEVFHGHCLMTVNIFPDFWYTETSFIIGPFLSIQFHYMGIDKNSFQAGIRWEILPLNDSIWVPPTYNECTMDTIGKLKSNCWYLFKGLHNFGYKYFVYFDNSGEAKVYEVNKSNY